MIIDGKAIAAEIIGGLTEIAKSQPRKRVCFVNFKDSGETSKFLKVKTAVADKIGIDTYLVEKKGANATEAQNTLEEVFEENYDGVVVQLPLPIDIDPEELLNTLPTEVDIDLLSHRAKALFFAGGTKRLPPVAGAIKEILERAHFNYKDKKVLILGRGRLVGEPVSLMFRTYDISYVIADADTPLEERLQLISSADLIVSGIGVPHFIKPEMVKRGVVIIDAGTSEQAGKLLGDAHPDCAQVTSLFTPVPGGVGPITVACLFRNLFSD